MLPVGDDHFLDGVVFGFGHGLEGVDVALEEGGEGAGGFSGEEDGFGELGVFELALRGGGAFEAAGGGGGAFGFQAVGAGGGELLLGARVFGLEAETWIGFWVRFGGLWRGSGVRGDGGFGILHWLLLLDLLYRAGEKCGLWKSGYVVERVGENKCGLFVYDDFRGSRFGPCRGGIAARSAEVEVY